MNASFEIQSIDTLDALAPDKVHTALSRAFGKMIHPHYLQKLTQFDRAYITSDYTGLAIICRLKETLVYLDKFAVVPEKQGSGLGKTLWETVLTHHPQLAWRAAKNNIFNTVYQTQADDMFETPDWHLYIKGTTFNKHPELIDLLANRPISFIQPS